MDRHHLLPKSSLDSDFIKVFNNNNNININNNDNDDKNGDENGEENGLINEVNKVVWDSCTSGTPSSANTQRSYEVEELIVVDHGYSRGIAISQFSHLNIHSTSTLTPRRLATILRSPRCPIFIEAWDSLRRSLVYFRGAPVGTIAALDLTKDTLNYNQVSMCMYNIWFRKDHIYQKSTISNLGKHSLKQSKIVKTLWCTNASDERVN